MIVRENGIIVGMIDDKTMELTDVESTRLKDLIDDWRKNGITVFVSGGSGGDPTIKSDEEASFAFDSNMLGAIENQLLIEGFEVQTE